MTYPPAKKSTLRSLAEVALAAAVLITTGRIIQLGLGATAGLPSSVSAAAGPALSSFADSKPCPPASVLPSRADAELAELYKSCPLAAVIDLQTVATSPERVDALLPPYRPTADHVPNPPIEPAIPRIRYPVRLRPVAAAATTHTDELRIAQVPTTPRPAGERSGEGATTEPSPDPSLIGRGKAGDWLIDPKDWYTPDEKPSSDVGGVSDAESSPPSVVGGVSDADVAQPSEPPSASERPPTNPSQPLFSSPPPVGGPPAPPFAGGLAPTAPRPGVDPHLELFTKSAYPSARECAVCHEEIYNQWSVSAHAYAAVSPMFNKFEQKLNDLSKGTVGYFCMRCHAPVATSLCASRDEPLWNLPEAAREGITCVACHRVQYAYGKANGERRIETGDINAPVFGGIGGDGVAEAIAHKDQFKVKTAPNEPGPGQNIHIAGVYFQPLTRSEFCTPCHQVAVQPGIKLEVVWEQYRASPACKKGIQCQDCHMGRVPGLPLGYDCGPVAKVANKTVNDNRQKSNHIFYGPNYPIAHPGVFPFSLKANRWTMNQWLTFDWRAGWGTKEFEDRVAGGQMPAAFPPVWAEADDRLDAREIIDDNLKKLQLKRDIRVQVMENGSHVEGPIFDSPLCRGKDLDLHFIVTNTNDGHNLLTASLGAQPQLWANIVLIGPDGTRLWETGYTDSWNDVANIHSHDVRQKTAPYDWQLFNLQTMFLITGVKGTDREFYVPVNIDIDQLPFIRPGVQPISTINHPPFIRMESQSLAPLGSRRVPYRIPGALIRQPGTYRLSFRMRSRSEPIYFMQFCGATEEMVRAENEWMIDIHPMSVQFVVP